MGNFVEEYLTSLREEKGLGLVSSEFDDEFLEHEHEMLANDFALLQDISRTRLNPPNDQLKRRLEWNSSLIWEMRAILRFRLDTRFICFKPPPFKPEKTSVLTKSDWIEAHEKAYSEICEKFSQLMTIDTPGMELPSAADVKAIKEMLEARLDRLECDESEKISELKRFLDTTLKV